MNNERLEALKEFWFIYGNSGKYSNLTHHKFIQQFIEVWEIDGVLPDIEKLRKHYKLRKSNPCYVIVKGILN